MSNGRRMNLPALLLSLAALATQWTALAYPGGSGTCFADSQALTKGMGAAKAPGNGGFAIALSHNATFSEGAVLNVTITPTANATAAFKGLLLYAERQSDGLRLGRFVTPDLEQFGPMRERYDCHKNGANIASTICHKNAKLKQAPLSFEWVAPDFNLTEPAYFHAVVVTDKADDWFILDPVTASYKPGPGPTPDDPPGPGPNPKPDPSDSGKDDDKKFPVWGYILIATGAVALVGVIAGFIIRRASQKKQEPLLGAA